jgi:hypothetical protein
MGRRYDCSQFGGDKRLPIDNPSLLATTVRMQRRKYRIPPSLRGVQRLFLGFVASRSSHKLGVEIV